jgi:hypothetical protein
MNWKQHVAVNLVVDNALSWRRVVLEGVTEHHGSHDTRAVDTGLAVTDGWP